MEELICYSHNWVTIKSLWVLGTLRLLQFERLFNGFVHLIKIIDKVLSQVKGFLVVFYDLFFLFFCLISFFFNFGLLFNVAWVGNCEIFDE